jgi:ABC-2 type transport system permease protein
MGITARGEVLSPTRITAGATRLAVQIFLMVCLWHALYAHTTTSAGMTMPQAVTYAVLAVLAIRIRTTNRWGARDTVFQHMRYGTIVYWYLRPLSPRRYYLLREMGDQLYGLGWACAGYIICLAAGVVSPPAFVGAALAFAVTLALGQALLYYLVLITDQMCFWMIKNSTAVEILVFAQNLLSGAYAAIWFFPGPFREVSAVLPFQYTLGVPLSFYIGRLGVSALPGQVAVQIAWLTALAVVTRLLWRRAGERVVSQGG